MKRLILAAAAALVAASALPALADRDDHPAKHHHAKRAHHQAYDRDDWRPSGYSSNGYWNNGVWYPAATNAGYHYGYNNGSYNPHHTRYTDRDDYRYRDRDDRGRHPH